MTEHARITAPMTRAQKFQWYLERGLAEAVWRLPDAMSEEAVRRLVDRLEMGFEILRTSIDFADGERQQVVHGAGSPLVVVAPGYVPTLSRCLSDLASDFMANRHGRCGELLVQFFLIHHSEGQALALIADNVAVDAAFNSILDEEIAAALAAKSDADMVPRNTSVGLQPREMSAWELGPEGEREREDARRHLQYHFAVTPPRMHASPLSGSSGEARYYRCTLTLDAADSIFGRVISTAGLLPSALILTAFTGLMCWRAQTECCSVNVSVGNRHNREFRRVLCAMAQRALVVLRADDVPVREAAAGVQQSLLRAHPIHGRYDPSDLVEERMLAQRQRGRCLSTDLAFNFIPPPQGWTELMGSKHENSSPSEEHESEIAHETTSETHYEYGASLSVRWSGPHSVRLSVHGDSLALAGSECAALLKGIELVLRRVASGQECTAREIAGVIGLGRIQRNPRDVRVGDVWVDLAAIEAMLLEVHQVNYVNLEMVPSARPDEARLVARVGTDEESTLHAADIWARLMRAIDRGEILAVPHTCQIVPS